MSDTVASVDTSGLTRALNSLHDVLAAAGKDSDMSQLIQEESKMLVREIVRWTPPKSKAQGEHAIKIDLFGGKRHRSSANTLGIFFKPTDAELKGSRVVKIRGVPANQLFVTKSGEVWGVDQSNYVADASRDLMYAHHQKSRRPSDGRTTTAGSYSNTVGRWRFINALVTKKENLNAYFDWIKQRVGMSKATWARIGVQLGDGANYPDWITRHVPGVARMSFFKPELNGVTPSITFGSSARINKSQERNIRFSAYLRTKRIVNKVNALIRVYAKEIGESGVTRLKGRVQMMRDQNTTY